MLLLCLLSYSITDDPPTRLSSVLKLRIKFQRKNVYQLGLHITIFGSFRCKNHTAFVN